MTDWKIAMHWTAGGHYPSAVDLEHYHYVVDVTGGLHEGKHDPEDNVPPLQSGAYAAHTASFNSNAIGMAVCAMAGAKESPFDKGTHPIQPVQLRAFVRHVAELAHDLEIPCTPERIYTHAEVQPRFGVKQRGKWDIVWLPGMDAPGDPLKVGDELRKRISAEMLALRFGEEPLTTDESHAVTQPEPGLTLGDLARAMTKALEPFTKEP